jgi:hypothetical protein
MEGFYVAARRVCWNARYTYFIVVERELGCLLFVSPVWASASLGDMNVWMKGGSLSFRFLFYRMARESIKVWVGLAC